MSHLDQLDLVDLDILSSVGLPLELPGDAVVDFLLLTVSLLSSLYDLFRCTIVLYSVANQHSFLCTQSKASKQQGLIYN